jgi:ABC-type glycerol-3-phosphate transport system permease component
MATVSYASSDLAALRRRRVMHATTRLVLYVLALLAAACAVFPVVVALGTAVKQPGTSTSDASIWPAHPTWSNFVDVITGTDLQTYALNSAIVTFATTVIVLGFGSMAAYAFSRLRFFLKNVLYPLFLMGLMLPTVVVLVPLFQIERTLGLLNTYQGLVFPYVGFGLPFAILVLKSYFDSVPRELDEAAIVDGASRLRTFVSIMLPVTKPVLATVAIFQAVGAWNEFLLALLFMTKLSMRTVPLAIIPFIGQFGDQTEYMFALLLVITLPPVVLFIASQRHFVSGLTAGAIKG